MTTKDNRASRFALCRVHRLSRAAPPPNLRLNDESGVVLVAVLIGVALLLVLSTFGSRSARTELMVARNDMLAQKALAVAEAGVNEALARLDGNMSGGTFDDELGQDGAGIYGSMNNVGNETKTLNDREWKFGQFGNGNDDGYYVRLVDNFDEVPNSAYHDSDQRVALQSVGRVSGAERIVEVGLRPMALFQYAMFADESIELESIAYSDSYDPDVMMYCNQVPTSNHNCNTGYHCPEGNNEEGNIGTNGTASSVILLDSNRPAVYGDVETGPGSADDAVTGSDLVTGEIDEMPEFKDLADMDPPTVGGAPTHWGHVAPANGTVSTTFLSPGDHTFDSIEVDKESFTLQANADGEYNLFFQRMEMGGNAACNFMFNDGGFDVQFNLVVDDLIVNSNGSYDFIVTGNSKMRLFLNDNPSMSSNFNWGLSQFDATRMQIVCSPAVTDFTFASNTAYFGTIYCPQTDFVCAANITLYGAVVADTILMNTNSCVHYDERLGRQGEDCCRVEYWREVRAD